MSDPLLERFNEVKGLFLSVEAGLASIAAGIEDGNKVLAALGAIEAAMAAMTAALEAGGAGQAIDRLTTAVTEMRPQINVAPANVAVEAVMPPAPAPVLHFLPTDCVGAEWEVTLPGGRTMRIKRTQ